MGGRAALLTYRQLANICRRAGAELRRTNGSHNHWYFRGMMHTVSAHGPGFVLGRGAVRSLRKAWLLRADDGVSDEAFLAGDWEASPLGRSEPSEE